MAQIYPDLGREQLRRVIELNLSKSIFESWFSLKTLSNSVNPVNDTIDILFSCFTGGEKSKFLKKGGKY